ncbi:MAG: YciI family protein [Armatimonadota bacterium]
MSKLRLSLAILGLLALVSPALRAEEPKKPLIDPNEMTTYWWTFFVSGDNKTPLPREEAAAMQKAHIGNLERMWKEGKAVTAGPFGDRTPLRGIVILTVKTREEALAELKDDPFVKAGYLKPEIHQWMTFKSSFGKPVEPPQMVKYQFVLYKKGPSYTAESGEALREAHEAHLKYLLQGRKDGLLALVGPLTDAGDRQGILVFRTDDEAKAKAFVDADPHVKSGRLVAELHPLYLGKGVLDPAM